MLDATGWAQVSRRYLDWPSEESRLGAATCVVGTAAFCYCGASSPTSPSIDSRIRSAWPV